MFSKKLNRKTAGHYACLVAGAAILSFGLFNVHSQSRITEGGVLGMTLFLYHWTGISPGIFSFLLDMTCYLVGFRLLGKAFLKNAMFATCCYALFYRLWEFLWKKERRDAPSVDGSRRFSGKPAPFLLPKKV